MYGGQSVVYIAMSPAPNIWFHAKGNMYVIKPIGAFIDLDVGLYGLSVKTRLLASEAF